MTTDRDGLIELGDGLSLHRRTVLRIQFFLIDTMSKSGLDSWQLKQDLLSLIFRKTNITLPEDDLSTGPIQKGATGKLPVCTACLYLWQGALERDVENLIISKVDGVDMKSLNTRLRCSVSVDVQQTASKICSHWEATFGHSADGKFVLFGGCALDGNVEQPYRSFRQHLLLMSQLQNCQSSMFPVNQYESKALVLHFSCALKGAHKTR